MDKFISITSLSFGVACFLLALRVVMTADITVVNSDFFEFATLSIAAALNFHTVFRK